MKATNRKTLAIEYGVSRSTIRKWINQVPNMNLFSGQRVLTPKQIHLFFEFHGSPDGK